MGDPHECCSDPTQYVKGAIYAPQMTFFGAGDLG